MGFPTSTRPTSMGKSNLDPSDHRVVDLHGVASSPSHMTLIRRVSNTDKQHAYVKIHPSDPDDHTTRAIGPDLNSEWMMDADMDRNYGNNEQGFDEKVDNGDEDLGTIVLETNQ